MSDGTAEEWLDALGMDTKAVMKEFEKGGPEAQKAIGDIMQALKDCDDETMQYQAAVGMFGTMAEDLGVETVAALMSAQGEISKTADAMGEMDAAAYDTLENSMTTLGRTIRAEVVQPIADSLIPAAKSAVDFVTNSVGPAVDWLVGHLPEIGIVLAAVGATVAAVKWGAIVAQITKIGTAIAGFAKGVMAALAGISTPILATIGIVAGLGLVFVKLWKENDAFREKITAIWERIKGIFDGFGQGITDRLNALGFEFSGFADVVGAVWDGFCNLLGPVFEGAFSGIADTLELVFNTLTGLFDVFAGIFTGDWQMVWEGVKEIFGGAWNFVVNIFSTALGTLRGLADTVLGWFGTSWSETWTAVKAFFVETWTSISEFCSSIWSGIVSAFKTAWSGIKSGVLTDANAVRSTVSNIWNDIKSVTSSAWNGIKNAIVTPICAAKDAVKGVIDSIKGWFSGLKLNLPKIKLPHFSVEGKLSILPPSVPKLNIEWYKEGGIMTRPTIFGGSSDTLFAGGEAGAEAIIPLATLWEKMDTIIRGVFAQASTGGPPPADGGLLAKAGELLTLEGFSLGSLADGTSIVIYYDFSGFTWSPHIETDGEAGEDGDDIMARLRAHEAEFFDWLEEFVQMREVAAYA